MSEPAPSALELPDDVWFRLGKETEEEFEKALATLASDLGVSEDDALGRTVQAAYREAMG